MVPWVAFTGMLLNDARYRSPHVRRKSAWQFCNFVDFFFFSAKRPKIGDYFAIKILQFAWHTLQAFACCGHSDKRRRAMTQWPVDFDRNLGSFSTRSHCYSFTKTDYYRFPINGWLAVQRVSSNWFSNRHSRSVCGAAAGIFSTTGSHPWTRINAKQMTAGSNSYSITRNEIKSTQDRDSRKAFAIFFSSNFSVARFSCTPVHWRIETKSWCLHRIKEYILLMVCARHIDAVTTSTSAFDNRQRCWFSLFFSGSFLAHSAI